MKSVFVAALLLGAIEGLTLNQLSSDWVNDTDCLKNSSEPFCDRRAPLGEQAKTLAQSPPIANDPDHCVNDKSKPFCDRRAPGETQAKTLAQSPPIANDPDHCVNDKSKPFCDRRAPAESMAK